MVHLNGSSAANLKSGYRIAYNAIDVAMDTIKAMATPHPRDYYVQKESVFEAAQEQHFNRLDALRNIREEFQKLEDLVQDQIDLKKIR